MKYINKIIVPLSVLVILAMGFGSCKKEEDEGPVVPFVYNSLEATKYSAQSGEEVFITATASGKNLQYEWNATGGGTLAGSGPTILFVGAACCGDSSVVTCTVRDAYGNNAAKSVTIQLYE